MVAFGRRASHLSALAVELKASLVGGMDTRQRKLMLVIDAFHQRGQSLSCRSSKKTGMHPTDRASTILTKRF
jgi:hypothetical protein